MAVTNQSVTYFNFSGGLNTDASPLNRKPEEATEMLNMDLGIDGSLSPRKGMDFIGTGGYATSTFDYTSVFGEFTQEVPSVSVFKPTTSSGVVFTVIVAHVADKLHIYQYETLTDLIDLSIPLQTIDLSSYSNKQTHRKTQFTQDRNKLFLVNDQFPFGFIEYNQGTTTFSFTEQNIFIRDLSGDAVIDSYIRHNSKTYKAILTHTSSSATEPGVGVDWETYWVLVSGEDSNYTTAWVTATAYTSNIVELANQEWSSLALAAGRLWLAGNPQEQNTVYFSQSLYSENDDNFNRMYQFADPLNSLDSVAVDTDGGSLRITGAINIKTLVDFRGGILVFAENGVWYVRGSGGVFLATDFSVDKVSSDGVVGGSSVVSIEDSVVYFGLSNVYVVALKDVDIAPSTTIISTKIKELYNSIPLASKKSSQVIYEPTSKKMYLGTNFTYPSWLLTTNPERQPTMFRDFLIFDTRIQAWHKHSLVADDDGSKVAVGTMFVVDGGDTDFAQVVDGLGNQVVDGLGNDVIAADPAGGDLTTVLTTLLLKRNGNNVDYSFGVYTGKETTDFSKNAVDIEDYSSTARMAHQVLGDVVHQKQSPYVTTIFERVEDFVDDGSGNDTNPGGCLMRLSYNFATGDRSQKYGTQFQAYKPTKWSISYFAGLDPNVEIVQNKHKVRGRGSVLQVEITNDPGKDFKLYGYQIEYTASRKV